MRGFQRRWTVALGAVENPRFSEATSVVGDSVWDMLAARRGRFFGIGVLSGGYGLEELERSGADRVYEDAADLLKHLDEVGGRR